MPFVLISYVLALGYLVVLADRGELEPWLLWLHSLPLGDKTLHLLLAGTLCLVANLTLVGRLPGRRWLAIGLGTGLTLLGVTAEEFSNLLVVHRGFSLADLAANYLGVLFIGVLPVISWLALRQPTPRIAANKMA